MSKNRKNNIDVASQNNNIQKKKTSSNETDVLTIVNKDESDAVLDKNSSNDIFDWPVVKGFTDLGQEKSRFQLAKKELDKTNNIDVNKIINGIANSSKKEDKQIQKEKRLDDKRLLQITGGQEQVNNQDSFEETQSRLPQENMSISTDESIKEGKNIESVASASSDGLGEKSKLSRRARARVARLNEQSDENRSHQNAEGDKVNGQSIEVVQGAVPQINPTGLSSVESNLQSEEVESAKSTEAAVKEVPSVVSDNLSAKVIVSETPASEGKGSLDKGKQKGTAASEGGQSLSITADASVIKKASKGFSVLFSEKTDEILSPLSFVADNKTKMVKAIIQLLIPALITYLLITNLTFLNVAFTNGHFIAKIILSVVFYMGSLCLSILLQVIASGIKGMFIRAFIDAVEIGEKKK